MKRKNYIKFNDDKLDIPVSTEVFVNYYIRRFESDLRNFFNIMDNYEKRSYPLSVDITCNCANRRRKSMVWSNRSHFYMFSAAVFYMSMCSQIIGKLYGWNLMENFLMASGWPMLNCGLVGLMHPISVMKASELYPLSQTDSYTQTLLNAGKYLKKDFLDFMGHDEFSLDNNAHDALVNEVNICDLSKIFDKQELLFCEWIRNPETTYERFYVVYSIEKFKELSMHKYLKQFSEDVPLWLKNYKPGDKVIFSDFMGCRIGYYPGSGYDGTLIKVGNRSHSVHCFLYTDYGISRSEMENHLAQKGCLNGYHSIGRVDWSDLVKIDCQYKFRKDIEPYCFMEIFERNSFMSEVWGAERLAVVFLCADGIKTYEQLFVNQYKKAPWIFLLQDHGFGGNYDKFGRGGALDKIIEKGEKPEFVICGENTEIWDGYSRMDRVSAVCIDNKRISKFLYSNKF